MSKAAITISPKWSDELARLLDELRVIVESCADAAEEFRRLRFKGADIFQAHCEPFSADGASQVVLLLEPTDRFRELVSALRALKVGGEVIERNSHGDPLQSGIDGCGDSDSTAAVDSHPNSRISA
ncbi:hypothetical protein KGP96_11705 [Burkholderia multivorans]|uniref:hypothetical protein n=1 Tax=Burkholderia multivorans TaxID=87883 RepID=UPI0020A1F4D8|nr:hypothetical protein [Burkholderia multivorans]MCO8625985.1 hypothetical protein [Burkholderia multivorans]